MRGTNTNYKTKSGTEFGLKATDLYKCLLAVVIAITMACSDAGQLKWADEFDGDLLDANYWNFEVGDGCPDLCGWGNDEPQIYTRSNHRLEDGFLFIRAEKTDSGYTSTRITTKNKVEFKYGRLEARAKIPTGTGVWPAIWLLGSNIDAVGWPRCGEIDVLEYVGKEPGKIFTTLHTQDSHGNSVNTKKMSIAGIEDGFHTYAMEWNPYSIEFFVDDKEVYTFEPENRSEEVWPFDQPFYLIINLAIGGTFGGPAIDDAIFPQEFIIDYIRIYENN